MNAIGVTCIALGVLIAATRAPLAIAPAATLRRLEWLVAGDARIRIVGAFVLLLGGAMAWAGQTSAGTLATLVSVWAWVIIGLAAVGMLAFPQIYRGLVAALLPIRDDSSLSGWRLLGLLGTGIGLALVYYGVRAL